MDVFDPFHICNHTDESGRYAYKVLTFSYDISNHHSLVQKYQLDMMYALLPWFRHKTDHMANQASMLSVHF
jgi:hypothetical protein